LKRKTSILIVGGTGFIGYHLAKKAQEYKWSVTSLSSKAPPKKRYLSGVKYLICNISNKKKLQKKIKKKYFNYVVNLGGYVNHFEKKKTYRSHYLGCKNLADIFIKNYPKSFLQMGSSGEYGNLKSPQKESSKCFPITVYARAKLSASSYLLKLFKEKKFPVTILRLYQAYGPKQDLNRFVPIIISNCIKNSKFPCSEGRQFRDFVYVDDVVSAIIKGLKNKNVLGKIINIGTGKPIKIKNIIQFINKNISGGYPLYGRVKLRKDENLKTYPDLKNAKKILRWKAKIKFYDGLKKTIRFYKNERKNVGL